ncbi:MAG: hypothetical protein SD837_10795 [Candidatus Electrothrix scaldis]|nr:MAG: hypothetical protein SD837_10795 [Candidatus Electrothrix sp. GW3-3]
MYLWKDENGVFNASEEIPGWWPPKTNCIAWVPGKENKVADFVKTTQKLALCLLPDNTKEKVKKQGQKKPRKNKLLKKKPPNQQTKKFGYIVLTKRVFCNF